MAAHARARVDHRMDRNVSAASGCAPRPSLSPGEDLATLQFSRCDRVRNAAGLTPGPAAPNLVRDLDRVVDLNAEIAHGALYLGMSKQKLDGAKVTGATIDQHRLRTAQRVLRGGFALISFPLFQGLRRIGVRSSISRLLSIVCLLVRETDNHVRRVERRSCYRTSPRLSLSILSNSSRGSSFGNPSPKISI